MTDLEDKRTITKEQGETLAKKYDTMLIETSAAEKINVSEAFNELAQLIKPSQVERTGSGRCIIS
jgi:hypothetical protein